MPFFKVPKLNRLFLNNPDKAMELYLLLMTEHPDSMYSGESRVKYRALREKIFLKLDIPAEI